MKKIIISLTTVLFSLYFILINSISVNASIVLNGRKEHINNLESFNVLKGIYDDKDLYQDICNTLGPIIDNGYLTIEMMVSFDNRDYIILEEQEYTNGILTRLTYCFDDWNLFEGQFDSNHDINILSDEDFNILLQYDVYDEVCYKLNDPYIIKKNNELITDTNILNTIKEYSFRYLYGSTYTYNEAYINNDLHVVMSYLNKKTMDEILDNLTLIDKTDINYEIVDNDYDYIYSGVGHYSFVIIVWDSNQNVTVQKVYVDIVDLTAPAIEQIKTTTFLYNENITLDDILECFYIDDIDANISIDMTDYLNHIGVVGEYNASITATDNSEYHNQSSLDFIIKIEDKIAPVLAMPSGIHLDYNTKRNIDEIKALFSADDEYDGNVSETITITDLDDYESNYDTLGVYRFNVCAIDNSNNETNATFYIYVEDYTAPVLTIDKYVIITERYRPITKEQIISLFNDLGYNLDGSDINSECFNLDSLDGEYDLEINLNDGSVEYDIITTEKNNPISFEIPDNTKKNINISLVISLAIGGLLLSVILVMVIIVYKKRH